MSVDTSLESESIPLQALLPTTLLSLVLTQFLPLRLEVLCRPGFSVWSRFAQSFLKMLFTEGLWPLDYSSSSGNLFKMSHA